jgi:hypothetical protein
MLPRDEKVRNIAAWRGKYLVSGWLTTSRDGDHSNRLDGSPTDPSDSLAEGLTDARRRVRAQNRDKQGHRVQAARRNLDKPFISRK